MKRSEAIAKALKAGHRIETKTFAVGGGEWSIEVWADGECIAEYVGENGTRNPATDLWSEYNDDFDAALESIGKPRQIATAEERRQVRASMPPRPRNSGNWRV